MTPETVYAEALLRAVAKGISVQYALSRLEKILEAQGMQSLRPRILNAVKNTAARQAKAERVTLTVSHRAYAQEALEEAEVDLKRIGISADEVIVVIDPHIVGGWILEGRGHRLDKSYKRALVSLYQHMVQDNH